MSKEEFESPFPPVRLETWRQRVEGELKGASFERALTHQTLDGLTIQPLYVESGLEQAESVGFPGLPPFVRGSVLASEEPRPWKVGQEYRATEPEKSRQAIGEDIEQGLDLLWLRWESREVAAADALGRLLEGVDPTVFALALETGGSMADLVQPLRQRGWGAEGSLGGNLGLDPLASLALGEERPSWSEAKAQLPKRVERCRQELPAFRPLLISIRRYHEAGASPAQELAFALASGVEMLRLLTGIGMSLEMAAQQIELAFCLGSELFPEIAKLRAARLLWSKALSAAGASPAAQALFIHAGGSSSTASRLDPWTNQLRGTSQAMAAAMGGVQSFVLPPYDALAGETSSLGRRVALHAQHILASEAHLGRVTDPAGGSAYVEALTQDLARAAWTLFQTIEAGGGMAEALLRGEIQAAVEEMAERRRERVSTRAEGLVGVSLFPNLGEAPLAPPEALLGGKGAPPLEGLRWAEGFEALRQRGDRLAEGMDRRPTAFLVRVGTRAEHAPRASFAAGALAVAGVVSSGEGVWEKQEELLAAFADSGSRLAVLCAADEARADLLAELAPALRESGARLVLVAGAPAEKSGGDEHADDHLYTGCDLLAVLDRVLKVLEDSAEGVQA